MTPATNARYKPSNRPKHSVAEGVCRISFGSRDGWDCADRHHVADVIRDAVRAGAERIAVDFAGAWKLPSGTWGMLAGWQDKGIEVLLSGVSPAVRRMLWFRHYAEPLGDGTYRLTGERQEEFGPEGAGTEGEATAAAWIKDVPVFAAAPVVKVPRVPSNRPRPVPAEKAACERCRVPKISRSLHACPDCGRKVCASCRVRRAGVIYHCTSCVSRSAVQA